MSAAVVSVVGRVKFWDVPRGFGFLVSDALEGDVLIHRSILRGHGVRILPEGTIAEVDVQQGDRGLQASRITSLDLRDAQPPRPASASRRTSLKDSRGALGHPPVPRGKIMLDWVPKFTASLDAAMTLVPEAVWSQRISTGGNISGAFVEMWMRPGHPTIKGDGRTPALALCAAALRSRSEKGGTING